MDYTVVNLEAGMPTVEKARIKLEQALRTAKAKRQPVIKLIHGYGSSGKGGAIKRDVHTVLSQRQRAGQIQSFVPGEQFSPFDERARQMVAVCPALARDRDYSACNQGITMVLI